MDKVNDMHVHAGVAKNYTIREEQLGGRTHIVVPVVMMVQGVHSGSHGPILHLAEELGKFPGAWDGIPVSIQHPQEDGMHVSANQPHILDEYVVGRVFNTMIDGHKLKAEAWLDPVVLKNISPEAMQYIIEGKPLDVSVGVFTDEDMRAGDYEGKHYEAVARNHRPDHLALLPVNADGTGGTGACSWSSGCGVRVNNNPGWSDEARAAAAAARGAHGPNQMPGSSMAGKSSVTAQAMSVRAAQVGTASAHEAAAQSHADAAKANEQSGNSEQAAFHQEKTDEHKKKAEEMKLAAHQGVTDMQTNAIKFDNTESIPWTKPTLADFGKGGNWATMDPADKADIANHFLIGDDAAANYGELMFPVVNPKSGKLNEQALRAVIGGRGAQANITSAQRISARRQAYRLLNSEFDAKLDVPSTLAADIAVHEDGGLKELARLGFSINEIGYSELRNIIQAKLDRMDDDTKVHYLEEIFSDYFIYRIGARNGISPPDAVESLFKRNYTVADDGTVEFTGESMPVIKRVSYDPASQRGGMNNMAEQKKPCCEAKVQMLIESGVYAETDRDRLLTMEESDIDVLAAGVTAKAALQAKIDEMAAEMKAMKDKLATMQANADTQTTKEQALEVLKADLGDKDKFLALAPKEIRSTLEHGLRLHQDERNRQIAHIMANTNEGVYTKERLEAMDDQDLSFLAQAIKAPVDYSGQAPIPQVNRGSHEAQAVYPPGVD